MRLGRSVGASEEELGLAGVVEAPVAGVVSSVEEVGALVSPGFASEVPGFVVPSVGVVVDPSTPVVVSEDGVVPGVVRVPSVVVAPSTADGRD